MVDLTGYTGIAKWLVAGAIVISMIIAAILIIPRVNIEIIQGDAPCEFPSHVCNFGTLLGFPSGWLRPDTFIWYGFLPLMGVTLIVYGFLTVINIFGRGRPGFYFLLAFLIAFSTIPMGLFVVFVSAVFAFIGSWATIIFAIMFIGGTIYFFVARTRSWRAGGFAKESFDRERDKIRNEITFGHKLLKDLDAEMKRIRKLPPDKQQALIIDWQRRRKQAQDIVKAGQESLKIVGQQERKYLKRLKKL